MNFDFPAQPAQAVTPTVYDLLGLFKGHKNIPYDLALKVLARIPASAALTGLGVMDDSHIQAAELDGYIQGCFHGIKSQGRDPDGTEAFVEVHETITGYLRVKVNCNSPMSLFWKSCAIGVLLKKVGDHDALAELRPKFNDTPYLELMMVEPEPSPAYQVHQGDSSPSLNMDWFAAGFAQAQAQEPFVHAELPGDQPYGSPLPQQGPYMSGGLSGLNISPSPQPNQFRQGSPNKSSGFSFAAPGSASGRSATSHPSFNSPMRSPSQQLSPFSNVGSPAPGQSPFFNVDGSAYGSVGSFTPSQHQTPFLNRNPGFGSMPAASHSPTASSLSGHSPNPPRFNTPQWNTPARTLSPMRSLSPLSNVFSNFHVGSTSGYRQNLSPLPSMASRMSAGHDHDSRQSVSPAPSMASHTHSPSPSVVATPSIASQLWASPSPPADMPAQSQHQNLATAGQDMSPMSHLLFGQNDNTAEPQGSQNGRIDMQSPTQSIDSVLFGGIPYIDLTTPNQSPQQGPGSPVFDPTLAQSDSPMADAPGLNSGQQQGQGQGVAAGIQQQNDGGSPGDADSLFGDDGYNGWYVDDSETPREVVIVDGALKRLPKTT